MLDLLNRVGGCGVNYEILELVRWILEEVNEVLEVCLIILNVEM